MDSDKVAVRRIFIESLIKYVGTSNYVIAPLMTFLVV